MHDRSNRPTSDRPGNESQGRLGQQRRQQHGSSARSSREPPNGPTYTINGFPQPGSPNYAGLIDSQTDVRDATNSPNAPWPAYVTCNVPADSDHDGLPDWWEQLKALNPNSAPGNFSDSNADADGDGYTNLPTPPPLK